MSKEDMKQQFDDASCTCDHKKDPLPKITPEMREELRKDFPEGAYQKHPTKSYLTTLKAAYVMERLNDVFGVGRWTIEHSVVKDTDNYVLMSGRIVSLDYDVAVPVQYGGHATTGKNTELADGYKSAITDILSKSASYLEVALEMFKGNINPGEQKPDHRQGSNQQSQVIPDDKWLDFYEKWNGRVYAGSHVYYNDVKYSLSEKQSKYLNDHPKKEQNASSQ